MVSCAAEPHAELPLPDGGIEILVGLLLLQDRWGLRRRTPWLNSERKAVAMLAWAVLLGLGAAALWATSA